MNAPLDRRTVLRGAGAALALPFLDAMLPGRGLVTRTAAAAARAAMLADAPARMMFVFVPNGVEPTAWPGSALEALAPHQGHFTLMRGLSHRNAAALGDGPGDHARSAACFLTGVHPKKTSGGDITAGVSVDQLAARRLGGRTRLDSLELGGEPTMRAGGLRFRLQLRLQRQHLLARAAHTQRQGARSAPRLRAALRRRPGGRVGGCARSPDRAAPEHPRCPRRPGLGPARPARRRRRAQARRVPRGRARARASGGGHGTHRHRRGTGRRRARP